MRNNFRKLALAFLYAGAMVRAASAQSTPGYNNNIPEKIMIPDKVETHFGVLNFVDGVPTAETTQRIYDKLDYIRGVEVFLSFIPATSMEGIRLGSIELGANKSHQAVIMIRSAGTVVRQNLAAGGNRVVKAGRMMRRFGLLRKSGIGKWD